MCNLFWLLISHACSCSHISFVVAVEDFSRSYVLCCDCRNHVFAVVLKDINGEVLIHFIKVTCQHTDMATIKRWYVRERL